MLYLCDVALFFFFLLPLLFFFLFLPLRRVLNLCEFVFLLFTYYHVFVCFLAFYLCFYVLF